MFTSEEKKRIVEYYNMAWKRIDDYNIACFKGYDKPVFLISDTYPGIWLEHAYDSVFLSKMNKKYLNITKNTLNLFLNNQDKYGQLPCFVIDKNKGPGWPEIGFSQTQECVSFARLCFEYYEMSQDVDFLTDAYDKCKKWQLWYQNYRMPNKIGLVEIFCGHDTGHDGSGRKEGMYYRKSAKNNDAKEYPVGDDVLPMVAPDVNAVYYGTLVALSKMADILHNESEKKLWQQKSEELKKKLIDVCFDYDDYFFYDVDKNGIRRKYLSISITNVLSEHLLDQEMAEKIIERHIKNPDEFYTDFPFPAMAKADSTFVKNKDGNSWGYYSQALTMLRCTMWMDYYGFSKDFDIVLEKWVRKWTFGNDIMFGQELDPLTGKTSNCSEWYSSCMLIYVYAVKRLNIL